jgi:LPS-assembly protein
MGRRFCPAGLITPIARARRIIRLSFALALALPGAAVLSGAASAAADKPAGQTEKTVQGENAKMLVEANELVYNTVKNTVSAEGNVRIYYKGRTLEADRVVYDRNTGRIYAEGHVKLTERDGTVIHAEQLDLTDDFKNGFIESLRVETPPHKYVSPPPAMYPFSAIGAEGLFTGTYKSYFSAPRAERIEGVTTVFDRGTYTACEPCKDNPDKPPLWRVRAKRIIHNNDEKMIYYEDADLEFLNIPVAYTPFLSSPDPSVTRKSGLLSPYLADHSYLGYGFGIPIFWALAPSYDLTFTPVYYTEQGFFGSAEWRQKLENGTYYILATGINEQNPGVFPVAPYDSGSQALRGSLESKGLFNITDQWKFGWEFTLLSDKWYLNDYHVPSQTLTSNYYSETTSDVYLTGQSGRAYFDLRGYSFEGLSSHDFQPQQPIAHPVLDYNRTFDIDPSKSFGIGGQAEIDFNLTSLSASSASFQSVGQPVYDSAYGLYNVCTNYVPGQVTGTCLLRGVGGDYTRATGQASWERQYIDPIGEVFTPFAFARVNGEWLDLNTTNSYTFASTVGSSTYYNASQLNFTGYNQPPVFGELMPGAGLDYRYPFLVKTGFGSGVLEPIVQIVARPNQQIGSQSLVNLDAQSLVFDTSNLFDWSKYSGYDRFETGTRLNYGGQFTMNFNGGAYANIMAGQSYQLAGTNSYATPDAANVGLSSGLDTRLSDYVSSLTIAPNPLLSFLAKARFDVSSFEPRRIDVSTNLNFGALIGSIQFADYQAQPVIGYYVRREGLSLSAIYKISQNYFAQGNITFDMSRQYYPEYLIGYTYPGPFVPAAFGVGAGYQDDCVSFSVQYSSIYQDYGTTSLTRNQTFLVQLQLRTLGATKFTQSYLNSTTLDGVTRY